jgi:hypothetical protein
MLYAPEVSGYILLPMGCGITNVIFIVFNGIREFRFAPFEVESPQLARTCNEKPELLLKYLLQLTAPNKKPALLYKNRFYENDFD